MHEVERNISFLAILLSNFEERLYLNGYLKYPPSQKFPSNCAGHSQVATPFISLHVPEFLHGLGEHGFATVEKKGTRICTTNIYKGSVL